MDKKEAKRIIDVAFKDIFGTGNPLSLEESLKIFASDVPLPKETKSTIDIEETTWGMFNKGDKVAAQADLISRSVKDEFMQPKKPINSVDDLLKIWNDLNIITGERYLESNEVAESDAIYNSFGVYRSMLMFGSQYAVYSYNSSNSKYLVASRDCDSCTNCIKLDQSGYCTSSYEVIWAKKVSRSLFINNCFDLYECMFCNNIRSKKYCIGNMQYEKDEYMKIKGMVIEWIIGDMKRRAKG
jgi:hypothetical protein